MKRVPARYLKKHAPPPALYVFFLAYSAASAMSASPHDGAHL